MGARGAAFNAKPDCMAKGLENARCLAQWSATSAMFLDGTMVSTLFRAGPPSGKILGGDSGTANIYVSLPMTEEREANPHSWGYERRRYPLREGGIPKEGKREK